MRGLLVWCDVFIACLRGRMRSGVRLLMRCGMLVGCARAVLTACMTAGVIRRYRGSGNKRRNGGVRATRGGQRLPRPAKCEQAKQPVNCRHPSHKSRPFNAPSLPISGHYSSTSPTLAAN